MKNIKSIQIIMLIAGILLASCGNKFSLTKRHYQKGYYFARNGTPAKQPDHQKEKNSKTLVAKLTKQQMTENTNAATNLPDVKTVFKQGDLDLISRTKNAKPATTVPHLSKTETTFEQDLLNEEYRQPPSRNFGLSASHHQMTERSSDEGRSLFWIVVLVLVILWALGYISGGLGLGILINLLLLVALILLILWLFRIV